MRYTCNVIFKNDFYITIRVFIFEPKIYLYYGKSTPAVSVTITVNPSLIRNLSRLPCQSRMPVADDVCSTIAVCFAHYIHISILFRNQSGFFFVIQC